MDYRLPLGMSIGFCGEDFYENLAEVEKNGFEYIDFDIASSWRRPEMEEKYYRDLEKGIAAVRDAGLKINAVHLSFGKKWDPADKWPHRRKKAVDRLVEIIRRLDPHGPFLYVLHGSFEPIGKLTRERRKKNLLVSLKTLCAATRNTICLEILPRTCLLNTSAEAIEILDRANQKNLKICLDTNHFLQEKTEDAILALAGRIATTHVSDHDYRDERHLLPGEGKIDWNAVLAALEKTGYQGVFNYELKHPRIAEAKANYEQLFGEYNKNKRACGVILREYTAMI